MTATGTMYTALDEKNDSDNVSSLMSRSNFDAVKPTAPTGTVTVKDESGNFVSQAVSCGVLTGDTDYYWWLGDMFNYADSDPTYDEGKPWEKTEDDIPAIWTQGAGVVDELTGMYAITFGDMRGVPLYNNDGSLNAQWDLFICRPKTGEIRLSPRRGWCC